MPLHLLGKKSWNVYNAENIARVRRDEAQAQAREEEEERRMQEVDAERRIQILRGERPPTPPPPPSEPSADQRDRRHGDDGSRYRKRRRIAGENDTDRDIRFAQEDAALALAKREELLGFSSGDAPLVDSAGHINLFPEKETGKKSVEKNAEAEAEASKKKREFEDQYTMRFSNAAGFKESVGRNPWYSSSGKEAVAPDSIADKDVWGNEDPRRREREKARVDANDPLAMMKKGVRQLKEVERERKKWQEERIRELESLKREEEKKSRRRRRHRSRSRSAGSVDSLEGFSLDATLDGEREQRSKRTHSHRHHHRHHNHRHERSSERKSRHSHSRSHRDQRKSRSHGQEHDHSADRYKATYSDKRDDREPLRPY
ncbi:hypothetical protein Plec18167_006287 [Paecilomyces lecythidis]|uniref:CBF1-interacting co-repressor CIR N-terminal domain-containing protein n=1 Tax=Paecilomyces lecythidis TaxID=3004212 RepID=A0ABR3XDQ8_9EURO